MRRNQLIDKDGETADAGVRGDGCGLRLPSRVGLGQGPGARSPSVPLTEWGCPPLQENSAGAWHRCQRSGGSAPMEVWELLLNSLLSWGAVAKRKAGGVLEFEEEGSGPRRLRGWESSTPAWYVGFLAKAGSPPEI